MDELDNKKKKPFHLDFWIATIFMVLMVVVVLIQVIFRFWGHPLSWPEEVARWFLIWITFAGSSYCFKNGGLISVDFFVKKLFPKFLNQLEIIRMGLTIVYFAVLVISSAAYCKVTLDKSQVYPITKMPSSFTGLALVIGGALAIYYCIKQIMLVLHARSEDKGGEK